MMMEFIALCCCFIAASFTIVWCKLMYEVYHEIDYIQIKRHLEDVKGKKK